MVALNGTANQAKFEKVGHGGNVAATDPVWHEQWIRALHDIHLQFVSMPEFEFQAQRAIALIRNNKVTHTEDYVSVEIDNHEWRVSFDQPCDCNWSGVGRCVHETAASMYSRAYSQAQNATEDALMEAAMQEEQAIEEAPYSPDENPHAEHAYQISVKADTTGEVSVLVNVRSDDLSHAIAQTREAMRQLKPSFDRLGIVLGKARAGNESTIVTPGAEPHPERKPCDLHAGQYLYRNPSKHGGYFYSHRVQRNDGTGGYWRGDRVKWDDAPKGR